jgi:hypothetical protein
MTKTKKLKFYTCRFFHDVKRRILCIDMFKDNKLVHKAQMINISTKNTQDIINEFDDEMAQEIKSLEIEIL